MEVHEVMAWLCRVSAPERDLAPLPERLCLACVAVSGADGGAITVQYTSPDRMTLFASDWVAGRLEDLQEVVGEGPGWDAHDEEDAVGGALGDTTLWPAFVPAALQELGSVWVCAAPIRAGGTQIAVLTLYWATTPQIDPDLPTVQFLADVVGAALYRSPQDDLTERAPWSSRAMIHQAAEVLGAELSIPPEDAMALLRARAYASSEALNIVANKVLSQEETFTPTHADTSENT